MRSASSSACLSLPFQPEGGGSPSGTPPDNGALGIDWLRSPCDFDLLDVPFECTELTEADSGKAFFPPPPTVALAETLEARRGRELYGTEATRCCCCTPGGALKYACVGDG